MTRATRILLSARRGALRCALGVLLLVGLVQLGCGKGGGLAGATSAAGSDGGAGAPIVRTTDVGLVKATVTLEPPHPRLGDSLTLTLAVEAQPGVAVEMPPFGEALGRFSIVSFVPRAETTREGGTRASQRYVLDPPQSGKQRIPPLRLQYTDRRLGAALVDGGAPEPKELLTDEVPVDIAAVVPEGEAAAALRPLRGELPEGPGAAATAGLVALGIGVVVALLAGFFGVRAYRRRGRRKAVLGAYDVAVLRLRELTARGLPAPEAADGWYVELSGIVRRYIEDRYGLRAPELTTEEFLREVQRAPFIELRHRALLGTFLSTCDRVKFAGYRPGAAESQQALDEAARFLHESRAAGAGGAPGGPAGGGGPAGAGGTPGAGPSPGGAADAA